MKTTEFSRNTLQFIYDMLACKENLVQASWIATWRNILCLPEEQ